MAVVSVGLYVDIEGPIDRPRRLGSHHNAELVYLQAMSMPGSLYYGSFRFGSL